MCPYLVEPSRKPLSPWLVSGLAYWTERDPRVRPVTAPDRAPEEELQLSLLDNAVRWAATASLQRSRFAMVSKPSTITVSATSRKFAILVKSSAFVVVNSG